MLIRRLAIWWLDHSALCSGRPLLNGPFNYVLIKVANRSAQSVNRVFLVGPVGALPLKLFCGPDLLCDC